MDKRLESTWRERIKCMDENWLAIGERRHQKRCRRRSRKIVSCMDGPMYTACLCILLLAQMIFAEGVPLTTSHLMCRNIFGFSPSPVCPVSHLFFALFATFGGMVSRSKLISMPGSARRPGFC